MTRGQLRVYLGAAPGVGKTYKMLEEGRRRRDRGTDVMVGFVETHGRPFTEAMLTGLEAVPRREVTYRGAAFTELDLAAVLARRPELVLVDELAHTNVPGSGHAKRWQDIEDLLEAGIDVLTTVNVQHLESVNDVVEEITGVPQRETVPDAVVRRAEQIELVDMTPEALRRRMAHGNVYKPDKIDAALGNYFRVGNLTALRELALLWLADKVDEQLDHYRAAHNIDATWETRERVVVALTGGPEGDTLIRRAARIAARTKGADLLAVHIVRGDGLSGSDPANLTRQRLLVESLGGTYHQVVGSNVSAALLDFARGVNATQLVLGASRRNRLAQILAPGVGVTTTAESGSIDVHLVTHEQARRGRLRLGPRGGGLTLRRRLLGFALAVAGLPLLTLGLGELRHEMALPSDILAYLVLAVAVALVGGLYPALLCAVGNPLDALEQLPADVRDMPLVQPLLRRPHFGTCTLSDVLSLSARRRHRLYVELYRPNGHTYQLIAPIAFRTGRAAARPHEAADGFESLSVARPDRDFSDRDRAVLAEFGRHVRAAHERLTRRPDLDAAGMTGRQREVLDLIGQGLTARSAAARLRITPKTAENHLQAAYRKLGVTNRVDALRRLHGLR